MKTKKLEKKISLNKTTIANLDQNDMISVQGGAKVDILDDRKSGLKDCNTVLAATCGCIISTVPPTVTIPPTVYYCSHDSNCAADLHN
ncbi:MAG: hypothetical protein GY765_05905 [bacterium]|nr:hypothetical protein [bacterium]